MNLNDYLTKGKSFSEYKVTINKQWEELKTHDPKGFENYYSLNINRMNRLEKTFALNENQLKRINNINSNLSILVISEGWCGDASQILPVAHTITSALENVALKIVFKDENPELMQNYLTNGSESIPILIGVSNEGKELFKFGPRPSYGMELLKKHKENPTEYPKSDFYKDLQVWYNKNKGEDIVNELLSLIEKT